MYVVELVVRRVRALVPKDASLPPEHRMVAVRFSHSPLGAQPLKGPYILPYGDVDVASALYRPFHEQPMPTRLNGKVVGQHEAFTTTLVYGFRVETEVAV